MYETDILDSIPDVEDASETAPPTTANDAVLIEPETETETELPLIGDVIAPVIPFSDGEVVLGDTPFSGDSDFPDMDEVIPYQPPDDEQHIVINEYYAPTQVAPASDLELETETETETEFEALLSLLQSEHEEQAAVADQMSLALSQIVLQQKAAHDNMVLLGSFSIGLLSMCFAALLVLIAARYIHS